MTEDFQDEPRHRTWRYGNLSDTVMGNWERPWSMHPPKGRWRFFRVSCSTREGVTELTPEVLMDVLRGMVDVGQLRPDDVVRDIVLINEKIVVRGWQHARSQLPMTVSDRLPYR